jgi:hypothetical protein
VCLNLERIYVLNTKEKRFNKEIIVLQCDKSGYDDPKELRRLWELRINKYFPEYRITKSTIYKNKGCLKVIE